jgi:hypothetical protein
MKSDWNEPEKYLVLEGFAGNLQTRNIRERLQQPTAATVKIIAESI